MSTVSVRADDPRHLLRFLKNEANMSVAQIAKSEGVSVQAVKDSIRMVERYRARNSAVQMEFEVRDLVVSMIPRAKRTLRGLLDATEQVEMVDPRTSQKRLVSRPDKTTRVEGMRLVADLIGKLQPKAPLTEVNVNQTNQVANLSSAETPEERFRRLRKQQQQFNALPPEVAGVPTVIDRGVAEEDDEDEEGEGEEEGEEEEPEEGVEEKA